MEYDNRTLRFLVLGHHCHVGNCLEGDFNLKTPVINVNNFDLFHDFIIDAVGICTEKLAWQKECTVETVRSSHARNFDVLLLYRVCRQ